MTIRILHIDSSILGSQSVSRELSAAIVERYKMRHPQAEVSYRDLAAAPLPHLDGQEFLAMRMQQAPDDAAAQSQRALGAAVLDEFLAADVIVLGVAFYNFGVASQLKAWIDRIAVPGKTFRYTEKGVEGLAGGKRVIMAVARGGYYGAGSPVASFEHAATYLRSVFTFAGITDIDMIAADGLAVSDEKRALAICLARLDIDKLSMA